MFRWGEAIELGLSKRGGNSASRESGAGIYPTKVMGESSIGSLSQTQHLDLLRRVQENPSQTPRDAPRTEAQQAGPDHRSDALE